MTLEEQKRLAEKLEEVGYAKCVDTSYTFTGDVFNKGDIGTVARIDHLLKNDLLEYQPECYALMFESHGHVHPVEYFEVPPEKELLMLQLQ